MIEKSEEQFESQNKDIGKSAALQKIKANVHKELLSVLDLNEAQKVPVEQLREECFNKVGGLLDDQNYPLSLHLRPIGTLAVLPSNESCFRGPIPIGRTGSTNPLHSHP